jgi:hypothetical protein
MVVILCCVLGLQEAAQAQPQRVAPERRLKTEVAQSPDDLSRQTKTPFRRAIEVQVKNGQGRPVPGGQVVVELPPTGVAGALFAEAEPTVQLTTNDQGIALFSGLSANNTRGDFKIQARAFFGGGTAARAIPETNTSPLLVTKRRLLILGAAWYLHSTSPPHRLSRSAPAFLEVRWTIPK